MISEFPKKIFIDKNVRGKINNFIKSLNIGSNPIIVCSSRIEKLIAGQIKEEIGADLMDASLLSEEEKIEKIKKYDFAIGIGGGKIIDITKHACFCAGKKWIAFPTILSHDGILSSRASLKKNNTKISVKCSEPYAIIADLDTIRKAPYRWMAAGFGDLLSNISAVEDWRIAERAGKEQYHALIAELALLAERSVATHTEHIRRMDYHGIEILLWALICSGFAMNIYGSSRPCSGSEHNFAHALESMNADILHGEACALGTIISLYLQKKNWRYAIEKMNAVGLPVSAKAAGLERETVIEALVKAKNIRKRYTVLNEYEITKERAEKILKDVNIID